MADPWWGDRRGPDPNIPVRLLLWTETITGKHDRIFKHCSFKATLVSHVLIEAIIEIDEICIAAWGWGGGDHSSPPEKQLLRTKKRANNFRNLTLFVSLWTNQVSLTIIDGMLIGCQTQPASKLSYLGEWNGSRKKGQASSEAARLTLLVQIGELGHSLSQTMVNCFVFDLIAIYG